MNIIDEYSRLCLAIRVDGRCKAVDMIAAIEELLGQYPAPTHLLANNGPEFMAASCPRLGEGSRPGVRSSVSGPNQTTPKQGVSRAGVVAETGLMPLVLQLMAAASQSQGCEGFKGSTAPRVR
jgi:hypothetical protein